MLQLVRHFGDQEDHGRPCGICDLCAQDACAVRHFRTPTPDEAAILHRVLRSLRQRDGQSTGQLFRELTADGHPTLERKAFERLLGGLARANLVTVQEDSFEKEGQLIRFQRATLTGDGFLGGTTPAEITALVQLTEEAAPAPKKKKKAKSPPPAPAPVEAGAPVREKRERRKQLTLIEGPVTADAVLPGLLEALKAWRRSEAGRRRIPAFRILTDRALTALASRRPTTEEELLTISGVGPTIVSKYGREILGILSGGG
jgi:DNA topoisomerase-3